MICSRSKWMSAMVFGVTLIGVAAPGAESVMAADAVGDKVLLKEGTDVKLKFAQELSSKTASEGDTVNLVLDEDLTVGGVVVAKVGDKAVGTVSSVKKAGMMGKGGELNVRLEHLKAGDTRIRLRGNKGKTGDDKTSQAVALTVLFGPIGLIKHGKDIVVKEGTPLAAYVDEDVSLAPVGTAGK